MNNKDRVNDEINALEKCFRPFIIKCIQAIVQARSGNVYKNMCMSDVGARNNMMVYIEDDPEIGATIKHSLDSGFSVKPGDSFTVEIYGKLGNDLPLLEVWHFTIESSAEVNNGNGGGSVGSNTSAGVNQNVPTDLRKTRFLERLGTLLKSILVTTRLLPAYWNSRNPVVTNEPMCFLVRRGHPNLSVMGTHCQGRSVGSLIVPTSSVALKIYVHYRSIEGIRVLRERQRSALVSTTQEAIKRQEVKEKLERRTEIPKLKNRPAFATNYVDYDDMNDDDDENEQYTNTNKCKRQAEDDEYYLEDEDDGDNDESSHIPISNAGSLPKLVNPVTKTRSEALLSAAMSSSPTDDSARTRLQLPFCSSQTSGADLSRQLSELKLRGDFDMFRPMPSSDMNSVGSNEINMSLMSLKDELFLHERTSVYFDEFLQKYEHQCHHQHHMQMNPSTNSTMAS